MKNKNVIWGNIIFSVLYFYFGSYNLLYSIKQFLSLEDGQHLLSYGWALVFMGSLSMIIISIYFIVLIMRNSIEKQNNGTQTSTKV